jgi:hypothetical protein
MGLAREQTTTFQIEIHLLGDQVQTEQSTIMIPQSLKPVIETFNFEFKQVLFLLLTFVE